MEVKVVSKVDLAPALQGGHDARLDRALMRAGSSALLSARAEAVRQVRQRRAIKASAVRDAIDLRYPLSPDPDGSLTWRLVVSHRPLPVVAYPHSQVRAGVSAQIKVSGRSLIRHAFVATMPKSGHRGVFMRTGRFKVTEGKRGPRRREIIKELFTTQVLDVFRDEGFVEAIAARATEVFERTLERNLAIAR